MVQGSGPPAKTSGKDLTHDRELLLKLNVAWAVHLTAESQTNLQF